jgi:hypothetical protein
MELRVGTGGFAPAGSTASPLIETRPACDVRAIGESRPLRVLYADPGLGRIFHEFMKQAVEGRRAIHPAWVSDAKQVRTLWQRGRFDFAILVLNNLGEPGSQRLTVPGPEDLIEPGPQNLPERGSNDPPELTPQNLPVPAWQNLPAAGSHDAAERDRGVLALLSWMRSRSPATILAVDGSRRREIGPAALRCGADGFFPLPCPVEPLLDFIRNRVA